MVELSDAHAVVVVPTIREACIREFLDAWGFGPQVTVLVIEDHPEPTFTLGDRPNVTHYSHADVERDLGRQAWIIPRGTDCVRSYGFYKAWQLKPDLIVTLDDDCFPIGEPATFIYDHWRALETPGRDDAWVSTLTAVKPRGMPYYHSHRERRTVLNHGLWQNTPDFDAVTQLAGQRAPKDFGFCSITVPRGKFFPMCGMNLAFRPEVTPALYFLLMGQGQAYDRAGDIWSGLFVKRICDHLGLAVKSGEPMVEHRRASNVWANLRKEAPGMELNETLWQAVDECRLTGNTFAECYRQLAAQVVLPGEYGQKLSVAMRTWAEMLQ